MTILAKTGTSFKSNLLEASVDIVTKLALFNYFFYFINQKKNRYHIYICGLF